MPTGPGAHKQTRVSVSDSLKRRELLEEFLFWYFDSFLLQLLKVSRCPAKPWSATDQELQTTFYITESSAFKNQVLYFRQDDWQTLCAPLVERLTATTFERMSEVVQSPYIEVSCLLNFHPVGSRGSSPPTQTWFFFRSTPTEGHWRQANCESATEEGAESQPLALETYIYLPLMLWITREPLAPSSLLIKSSRPHFIFSPMKRCVDASLTFFSLKQKVNA